MASWLANGEGKQGTHQLHVATQGKGCRNNHTQLSADMIDAFSLPRAIEFPSKVILGPAQLCKPATAQCSGHWALLPSFIPSFLPFFPPAFLPFLWPCETLERQIFPYKNGPPDCSKALCRIKQSISRGDPAIYESQVDIISPEGKVLDHWMTQTHQSSIPCSTFWEGTWSPKQTR